MAKAVPMERPLLGGWPDWISVSEHLETVKRMNSTLENQRERKYSGAAIIAVAKL